ncbi:MAG: hypothetical protein HOO67_04950, partial [Candidatus Peribacteraceae bacterium]|nr:hypothetical protein [Candidatus Peribacteraceae bacterium]
MAETAAFIAPPPTPNSATRKGETAPVPGSVIGIGAMVQNVARLKARLAPELGALVTDALESLQLAYARLLSVHGVQIGSDGDPLRGTRGALRQIKALELAAGNLAETLPSIERDHILRAIQDLNDAQRRAFVRQQYSGGNHHEATISGHSTHEAGLETWEHRCLISNFRMVVNQCCESHPDEPQQERRTRFRQWAEHEHGIVADDFTDLVYAVNRQYLPWLQNLIPTLEQSALATSQGVMNSIGSALSRALWMFDPAGSVSFAEFAEAKVRMQFRRYIESKRMDAGDDKQSTAASAAASDLRIETRKVAHGGPFLTQFNLSVSTLRESNPNVEQQERRSRFGKWADSEHGIVADDFTDLVYAVNRQYLPWLQSLMETLEIPANIEPISLMHSLGYALSRAIWMFDPENGKSFEEFAEPEIRSRFQKYSGKVEKNDAASEPVHAHERGAKTSARATSPNAVSDLESIAAHACANLTSDWRTARNVNEAERENRFRNWARGDGIEADDLFDVVHQMLLMQVPWVKQMIETTPLKPGTSTENVYRKVFKSVTMSLLLFDPDRSPAFQDFASVFVDRDLANYRTSPVPIDGNALGATGIETAAVQLIDPVPAASAELTKETTINVASPAKQPIQVETPVSRLWNQFSETDTGPVANEAFVNIRTRCPLKADANQQSFRSWAEAKGVANDNFEAVVSGMYLSYMPWLLTQLRQYSILATGDPKKTLHTACEMMAVSMHNFNPAISDDFPAYAWPYIFKRIGKFLRSTDGETPA